MVERATALGADFRPGADGDASGGIGVTISELTPGTIVEAAAWPGEEDALAAALGKATRLSLSSAAGCGACAKGNAAFVIGPGRFLIAGADAALAARLQEAVTAGTGTVTELSHGRTVLAVEGPKAEWVLSKLFAIDFSAAAFPEATGLTTAHHDMFVQIQRTGGERFELYACRSFARAFARALRHAAEETGYAIR